jgi:hypothetical protein
MAEEQRAAKAQPRRPIDRHRLILHLEAAVPEVDTYDSTSGFLLRLAIHSLRKNGEGPLEAPPELKKR